MAQSPCVIPHPLFGGFRGSGVASPSHEALHRPPPAQLAPPSRRSCARHHLQLVFSGSLQAVAGSPGRHGRGGDAEGTGEGGGDLLLVPATAAATSAPHLPAEMHREEPVDERIQARVEEAEEEEDVAERRRHLLPRQHLRGEPVPEAQEVVGRPADDEGEDDDDGHLERAHPGPGDVVVGAAELHLPGGDCGAETEREVGRREGGMRRPGGN